MASITIKTDLPSFSPVYNRMELSVDADAVTKALTDMEYVFDVYIENVSSPAYKRFIVPKDAVLGYGTKDIQGYCESACNSVLYQYNNTVAFETGARATGQQCVIKVTIKYGYRYRPTPTTITTFADVTVGSAKYAFQGSLTAQEFQGWNPTTYLCNIINGASAQFLTDMKYNKVSIGNFGAHTILTDTPTDIDYLVVKTYSNADYTGLIQTATKVNAVAQNLTVSRMYLVATAPETLNNMAGAFVTGAQPVITSSVKSYTIQLTNSANAVASEILYFVIEEPCRYEQRRVHFENRFGGFDSFNFNLRSQEKRDVVRKSYKTEKYPVVTAGIQRLYQDQAQVVNHVKTQDTLTIRCGFLTTLENTWLKQLIESPEIYLEFTDPTGAQNYLAYEYVQESAWIEKDASIDKLFNLELTLKLSQSNQRQRR